MKKVMLISALFFFGCSENMQRNFSLNYSIIVEPTNNKKLELWVPIPHSNEVQVINNIKIDTDELDYTIEDEEVHGNKYLYINHKEGTSAKKNIVISFDVNRLEHQNVQYDNVEPENYLGSYSLVPTGAFFSKIIEKTARDEIISRFEHLHQNQIRKKKSGEVVTDADLQSEKKLTKTDN